MSFLSVVHSSVSVGTINPVQTLKVWEASAGRTNHQLCHCTDDVTTLKVLGFMAGAITTALSVDADIYGAPAGIVFPERCPDWDADVAKTEYAAHGMSGLYEEVMNSVNSKGVNTPFTINGSSYSGVDDPALKTMISDIITGHIRCAAKGSGRSASDQAQMQLVAVVVTLAMAIVGGMLTGYVYVAHLSRASNAP